MGGVATTNPLSPLESETSSTSPLVPSSSDDNTSISSASGMEKSFVIPDSWPPTILQCIKLKTEEERKKALAPSVRNEIVRVLAASMFCHDPNPRKEFCAKVAKSLVKKYGFMRDVGEHVSGYVSFGFSDCSFPYYKFNLSVIHSSHCSNILM